MAIRHPDRLLSFISAHPWAIDEAKAREVLAFLEFRAEGGVRSEAEILEITSRKRDDTMVSGSGVAVLPLFGIVAHRVSGLRESSGFASLERFMAAFREAVADDGIGTIVLRVDSPGGSVSGIAEATDEIYRAREKKTIKTVADPLAASAAYSLGSSADEVIVTPSGMLGSIGVITVHVEFAEAYEKEGIGVSVLTAGKYKGEGNPHEKLSEDARAHIIETLDDYYTLFTDAVARNRGVTTKAVRNGLGEGRALTARRAVEAGLADRIATMDEVLAELGVRQRPRAVEMSEEGAPSVAAALELVPLLEGRASIVVPAGAVSTADQRITPPGAVEPLPSPTKQTVQTSALPDEAEASDAPGDAAVEPPSSPDSEPQRQEEHMAENASGPHQDAGAGTKTPSADEIRAHEAKRAEDISVLAHEHGVGDRAAGWIKDGLSADAVGREILRLKAEETKGKAAAPRPTEERKDGGAALIRRRFSSREDEPGFGFGMALLALAAVGAARKDGRTIRPTEWLAESGYPEFAAAMRSDRFDEGGAWVPENYLAGEFIELLRPESAVRKLMPRYVPLTGGNASIPKLTGGATAYYKGESLPGTKSQGTTGRVNLVGRELMAFVPLTSQFVRRASPDAAAMMRDDALAAVAQRSDLAFIRGDGTEHTPKGMRYQVHADNVIQANATVNLANVTTDLGKLRLALLNANVKLRRPGWIMAPRTENYLMTVRDGNGNYAFRPEMLTGKLWGYPYAVTTQVPINLSTDKSELYFADFSDLLVGEEENVQVDVFDQVTYWDGTAWQSAAQNNEIVLRICAEHDFGVRYDKALAVLYDVAWGV